MKPSLIAIAILFTCQLNADEITSAERAAKEFSIGKIHVSLSLKEFRRLYPDSQADKTFSDPRIDTLEFNLPPFPTPETPDVTVVRFYKGKVYEIGKILRSRTLSVVGGRAVIAKKMEGTFGVAHTNSASYNLRNAEFLSWVFRKVRRRVAFTYSGRDKMVLITVTDIDVDSQIEIANARLKAADEAASLNRIDLGF